MDAKLQAKKQEIRRLVLNYTLMDDNFMTVFFNDDLECTAFVLQVILGKPDLKVTQAKSQYTIANLKGRSARLDVRATDDAGKVYDIEIQRADSGAGAKRARYNSALMDADETVSGYDMEQLPETFVIFITENDVWNAGLPLYHIDRTVRELNVPFDDKSHIIYVNGKYRGDDPIGSLMHDFSCKEADDMKSTVLADKTRRLKTNEAEVKKMCRAVEELIFDDRMELALENLESGTLSEEQIGKAFHLTPEQVEKVLELYHRQKVAVQA